MLAETAPELGGPSEIDDSQGEPGPGRDRLLARNLWVRCRHSSFPNGSTMTESGAIFPCTSPISLAPALRRGLTTLPGPPSCAGLVFICAAVYLTFAYGDERRHAGSPIRSRRPSCARTLKARKAHWAAESKARSEPSPWFLGGAEFSALGMSMLGPYSMARPAGLVQIRNARKCTRRNQGRQRPPARQSLGGTSAEAHLSRQV